MRTRRLLLLGTAGLLLVAISWAMQGHDENPDFEPIPFDHAAIRYLDEPAGDPVARLETQIEKGEVRLEFQPKWGYLPSVLNRLGINIDSQVLVFSKTSSQNSHISPASPRAIYFNDTVSVGYVQGGDFLEAAALDPKQGVVFYLLDMHKPDPSKSEQPGFARQAMNCLQCHMSPATLNVPGVMVSSVSPAESPAGRVRAFVTDHRTPFEERWGGWYVTGSHGLIRHRGNVPVEMLQSLNHRIRRRART